MAETVVNILFQNLSAFLLEETSLQRGARGNFEEIKRELGSMRAFLRDADKRRESSDGLKMWIREVRNATYNIEDIIDEFIYHMNLQRSQKSNTTGCTYYIFKTIHLPKMIFYRHQLATQLQEAKTQIAAISCRKDQYKLTRAEEVASYNNDTERLKHRDVISAFKDSSEIVGLEDKTNELVEWLTSDDPGRNVIAVVGMGGLGKTTLVAQAFKNEKVKKHFECYAWVYVSQSYKIEELVKGVITDVFRFRADEVQASSDLNSMGHLQLLLQMDFRHLLQIVREYLGKKRYIMVLDDVWRAQAWEELKVVFPQNNNGSRIMLTTRQENIASSLGCRSRTYQLYPLNEEAAWHLFSKNAFWKNPCSKDLEPLARSIVGKCQGLPLAIVNLGSLLSLREQTVAEWEKVRDDLSRQLSENETIKPILLLSYYDLPYNLKHCFLYCCVFPEDQIFSRKLMIRLWVAEGFVQEEHRRRRKITMEEVAEEYLKELVHRNMLQVVNDPVSKKFRLHDLVRDVGLSVSEEQKFCCLINTNSSNDDDFEIQGGEMFRRIAIHAFGEATQLSVEIKEQQQMRSFLMFDKSVPVHSSSRLFNMMMMMASSSYRSIRVLHLDRAPIQRLPNEVTKLFNLRYLSLRDTQVSELPKSFEKLTNLQTLDLRGTKVESLPPGIGNLQKLRHLIRHGYRDIVPEFRSFSSQASIKIPPELCYITSLQTLYSIEAAGEIVTHLRNLTQLNKLRITNVREGDGVELCTSISKMKCLVYLSIAAMDEEALELEALFPIPLLLQKLQLQGHLEKVPQWLGSLTNLTHLHLSSSRLGEEEGNGLLLMLSSLSNLLFLSLWKAFQEDNQLQLRFQDGWFPKLETLLLWSLTMLKQVVIEKGAMSSLQRLLLANCPELKTLPQGIEHLAYLEDFRLLNMPWELVDKLRRRQSTDINENDEELEHEHQKVSHIPLIRHWWKTEYGRWDLERLN